MFNVDFYQKLLCIYWYHCTSSACWCHGLHQIDIWTLNQIGIYSIWWWLYKCFYMLLDFISKIFCWGFLHLLWLTHWKTLILGKTEGRRRRGGQGMKCWMASLNKWTWVWASSRSWWWTGKPGVLQSLGLQRVRHDWATELMMNIGL